MKRSLVTMGMVAALVAGSGTAFAGGTPAQKCSAAVRKCIGKLFSSIMTCHAKAAVKTVDDSTDQACVDAANTKWDACGAKQLAKGGCSIDQAGLDHIKTEDIAVWTLDMKGDSAP